MKDFLLSERSREFFLFLFFFCVAGAFWLLQTLNNDYETELSMPVRLTNVPDNVVITSEPASELRLRVKDKGTVLLNYKLGQRLQPLLLDYADYKGSNNHVRIAEADYRPMVQRLLGGSLKLQSVNPDTLEYIYATGASKRVPVRLKGRVSAGREYYLADTLFRPDSVLVYAPEKVLDTITVAYTTPVRLDDISDTLRRQVELQAQKGIKFVPATTEMTLPVDIYAENTVEVPLVGINFPPGKELRAFPSKVKVTFQIGMSRYREATAEDFKLFVSYEELLKLGSEKYTVRLTAQPKGVSKVRFNPEQVDFLIEHLSTHEEAR